MKFRGGRRAIAASLSAIPRAAKDWFTRWEKLFTVPGALLSLLLSVSAIVVSVVTLLHTSVFSRAQITALAGAFPLFTNAYDVISADTSASAVPDSMSIGHQRYRVDRNSGLLTRTLHRFAEPGVPGINFQLDAGKVPSLVYGLVHADFDRRVGAASPTEAGRARSPGIVPSAFMDSLETMRTEDTYLPLLAALHGLATVALPTILTTCPVLISNDGDRPAVLTGVEFRWMLYQFRDSSNVSLERAVPVASSNFVASDYGEISRLFGNAPWGTFSRRPLPLRPREVAQLEIHIDALDADRFLASIRDRLEPLYSGMLRVRLQFRVRYREGRGSRDAVSTTDISVAPLRKLSPDDSAKALRELWDEGPGVVLEPYDYPN